MEGAEVAAHREGVELGDGCWSWWGLDYVELKEICEPEARSLWTQPWSHR